VEEEEQKYGKRMVFKRCWKRREKD